MWRIVLWKHFFFKTQTLYVKLYERGSNSTRRKVNFSTKKKVILKSIGTNHMGNVCRDKVSNRVQEKTYIVSWSFLISLSILTLSFLKYCTSWSSELISNAVGSDEILYIVSVPRGASILTSGIGPKMLSKGIGSGLFHAISKVEPVLVTSSGGNSELPSRDDILGLFDIENKTKVLSCNVGWSTKTKEIGSQQKSTEVKFVFFIFY